jgi:hypothetical protein
MRVSRSLWCDGARFLPTRILGPFRLAALQCAARLRWCCPSASRRNAHLIPLVCELDGILGTRLRGRDSRCSLPGAAGESLKARWGRAQVTVDLLVR